MARRDRANDGGRSESPEAGRIPSPTEVLARAHRTVEEAGRAALAQIVRVEGSTPGKVGWKMLVRPDGEFAGNLGGGAFEAMVVADARSRLAAARPESEVKRYYLTEEAVRGEPTGMVCGGMVEVFLEIMTAPPLLVVCGGGPVGQAVARAGELAGFDLLVADDREEYRRPELFPPMTGFAAVGRGFEHPEAGPGEGFLAAVAGRDLHVAVVTRCWETDTAALDAVLRSQPPRLVYLGLMGSRRKVARVRQELEARGHDLDAPGAVRLHAPIGLAIGGDSPGEIAISILAEIVQTRHADQTERPDAPDDRDDSDPTDPATTIDRRGDRQTSETH